jgi:PAS domain S-box-containing protein
VLALYRRLRRPDLAAYALAFISALALAGAWVAGSPTLFGVFAFSAVLLAVLIVVGSVVQVDTAREERSAALTTLQAIVDSMADGVIFVDATNSIALLNERAKALRNLSDGPGRPLHECHPASTHDMLDRVMGWLRSGNDAGPAHSIIKEKEGRWETTYAPVRSAAGGYLGVVMVIRDIAARRNLERRLLDAERLAAVGQMSAQVAHELRNPLNAITGSAQYLRRILPDHAEVREYAELIDDEVRRVNRFVGELLKVARPSSAVLTPCSVNRLLTEAARKATLARGLPQGAVALDLAKALPPLDLDVEMVTEAVVNLLDNALDAGGSAAPEVVSTFEASGGEGAVIVEIRDRGCGIPADQLDEVTRPFVTTKSNGTGLGLVIVSRAMEQHRCGFALHAREGGGTVARLRFPVRTRKELEATAAAVASVG